MMTESTNIPEPVVYVVVNNPQSCHEVAELIQTFGHKVRLFETPSLFLEEVGSNCTGCVVLDLGSPNYVSTDVQKMLKKRGLTLPVIVLTSAVNTAQTVRSLLDGAYTVLEKPVRDDELWHAIQEASHLSKLEYERQSHVYSLENRLKKLTLQDRSVLKLMLQGIKNRSIAKRLGVSLRTVENRRRRVFDVMQADSVAQLTRMVVEYEYNLPPAGDGRDAWLSLPFEKAAC